MAWRNGCQARGHIPFFWYIILRVRNWHWCYGCKLSIVMLTALSILQLYLCNATDISSCLFANDLFIVTVISVVDLPKYARVNLLKSDVSLVIAAFKQDGYLLCDERCGALEHNNFSIDPILPDVLKFHPLAPLTTHPLHRDSHIILQDKVRPCFTCSLAYHWRARVSQPFSIISVLRMCMCV